MKKKNLTKLMSLTLALATTLTLTACGGGGDVSGAENTSSGPPGSPAAASVPPAGPQRDRGRSGASAAAASRRSFPYDKPAHRLSRAFGPSMRGGRVCFRCKFCQASGDRGSGSPLTARMYS